MVKRVQMTSFSLSIIKIELTSDGDNPNRATPYKMAMTSPGSRGNRDPDPRFHQG